MLRKLTFSYEDLFQKTLFCLVNAFTSALQFDLANLSCLFGLFEQKTTIFPIFFLKNKKITTIVDGHIVFVNFSMSLFLWLYWKNMTYTNGVGKIDNGRSGLLLYLNRRCRLGGFEDFEKYLYGFDYNTLNK